MCCSEDGGIIQDLSKELRGHANGIIEEILKEAICKAWRGSSEAARDW